MEENILLSKVVANPTETSWCQAYSTLNLFLVLSIEKEDPEENIAGFGKEILDRLTREFFALEEKSLTRLKEAVENMYKGLDKKVEFSLVLATIKEDMLYVVIANSGFALLRRGEKIGIVAEGEKEKVVAFSGRLGPGDIVILETYGFSKKVPIPKLAPNLLGSTIFDVAENLAPLVHEDSIGTEAAIILQYKAEKAVQEEEPLAQVETPREIEKQPILLHEKVSKIKTTILSILPPALLQRINKRYLLGFLIVLLIVVFAGSLLFERQSQEKKKREQILSQIISSAQKRYEEGQSLFSLNKNLAREDFLEARKILVNGRTKFKKGTSEEKKIATLLGKIEDALEGVSGTTVVEAKEVSGDNSSLLTFEKEQKDALFVSQDNNNFYLISKESIVLQDKKSNETRELVKNEGDWIDVGGFGVYLGNLYVLDKKEGRIIKFVLGADGYGRRDYLEDETSSDLTQAVSLSIDGSIWVLLSNGSIKKYLRGKEEGFSVSGLDRELSSPTRIFTDRDTDNLYILDNGNSRILVLGKEGGYIAQYQANSLKTARDLEVIEKDKKIFILSQNKIYEIELK